MPDSQYIVVEHTQKPLEGYRTLAPYEPLLWDPDYTTGVEDGSLKIIAGQDTALGFDAAMTIATDVRVDVFWEAAAAKAKRLDGSTDFKRFFDTCDILENTKRRYHPEG